MDGLLLVVVWTVVNHKSEWQDLLSECKLNSYLQMWDWGEYKSYSGWTPIRIVGYQDSDIKVMAQLLVRYYPLKLGVVWIPGGVVGELALWTESLLDAVKEFTKLNYLILKINDMRKKSGHDELLLENRGWSRSKSPLSTGLSLEWNIDKTESTIQSKLTKNWRHNLKRSNKYGLSFELWEQSNISDIRSLYEEMEQFKGLTQQFSFMEIKNIIEIMKDNLLLFRCFDEEKQLVAIRACIIVEDKAWDIMAVTGKNARKNYASYGLFWELIRECISKGVRWYDLGGVDPEKNRGVWNFKRGTGAEPIKYLGEWEYSNSQMFLIIVNFMIKFKSKLNPLNRSIKH